MALTSLTKKVLPGSLVEFEGEIDKDTLASFEDEVIQHLAEKQEIPGFRKGAAPKAVITKAFGEMVLLEEEAYRAIAAEYPRILEKEKVDAIGRPEVVITKIAKGENLGFRITTAVMPDITLPEYEKVFKKIKKEDSVEVTDEMVEKALQELRQMRAHEDAHIKMKAEGKDGHDHPEITDDMLPALDDAFAKTMGPFENLEGLRTTLKENMVKENEMRARDKTRVAIYDAMLENTTVEVPRILVELELDKMLARLRSDIERSGASLEEYLKNVKKNESDIRGEWKDDAEKRAKMELIVDAVWKKENMTYDDAVIENEVKNLIGLYPDADPLTIGEYVKNMTRNQKVFAFLEEKVA